MPSFIDRTNIKYGRLTARWPEGRRNKLIVWLCECECGTLVHIEGSHLGCGHTQSCGCLQRELTAIRCAARARHGHSRGGVISPEYSSYSAAKSRCNAPNATGAHRYGGRGIEFRFPSFEAFLAELGPRPSRKHSVDRWPNPDGHYEVGNVRWATCTEQANNKTPRPQHMAPCHPDRPYLARGFCRPCYKQNIEKRKSA